MPANLYVLRGDISLFQADAIVHPCATANAREAPGGVELALIHRGSAEVRAAVRHLPAMPLGHVHITEFTDSGLPARLLFHAAVKRTGRRSAATEESVRLAVRHCLEEAKRRGVRTLAFPALGTGWGRLDREPCARAMVDEILASERPDFPQDVYMVLYRDADYRAFMSVFAERLRHLPRIETPANARILEELVDEFASGQGVLFLGSGLSTGYYPSWAWLTKNFAKGIPGLDVPEDVASYSYPDVAQWYADTRGSRALQKTMVDAFQRTSLVPSAAHYQIASLPVRTIFTTNYDHLIEEALTALKRDFVVIRRDEQVGQIREGSATVYVVKLHGDIEDPDSIVLTRDSYNEYGDTHPAMVAYLEGLLLNKSFLFVGYSLTDPNFQQIHHRIARLLRGLKRDVVAVNLNTPAPVIESFRKKRLHIMSLDSAAESLRLLADLTTRVNIQRALRNPFAAASLREARRTVIAGFREEFRRCLADRDAEHARILLESLSEWTDERFTAEWLELGSQLARLAGIREKMRGVDAFVRAWADCDPEQEKTILKKLVSVARKAGDPRLEHYSALLQRL